MTRFPQPQPRVAARASVLLSVMCMATPTFATPFETHKPGIATNIEINPQMERDSSADETSWEFLLEAITPLRAGMELSVEQPYAIVKDSAGTHRGFKDL